MLKGKVVFVRCAFLRGNFPNDRFFVIRSEVGTELEGTASVDFCYTRDKTPLGDAPPAGQEVDGLVVGIVVGELQDGTLRLHLPDGEIYELDEDYTVPVRPEGAGNVSVKS